MAGASLLSATALTLDEIVDFIGIFGQVVELVGVGSQSFLYKNAFRNHDRGRTGSQDDLDEGR